MKTIIKFILNKISRIKYFLTPIEFRDKFKLMKRLEDDLLNNTIENFREHFKKSVLFSDTYWSTNSIVKIREYAIKKSLLNDEKKEHYYLEFGTFEGITANFFSNYLKKLYTFDSFEGLREDWGGIPTQFVGTAGEMGSFDLKKKIPNLKSNIVPIVGWVQDTLENFLEDHNPKINFVHLDLDTYDSTKFVLERVKPYLVKNAIIIFDELYNYIGWENGEYKALIEVFKKNEYEFKAFQISELLGKGSQCVIQIK
jgi:hypothetical protein